MGGSDSKLLDQPWRATDFRQKNELLSDVRGYKPDGASHLRILLYGPVGVGKSSFINSAATLILGRSVNTAAVDSANTSTQSCTKTYKTHRLRQSGKGIVPIVFNDLMGLEAGQNVGVQPHDIRLAMMGHVKDGYTFDKKKTLSPNHEKYNPNPTIDDRVHVLVCMLNANAPAIDPSVLEKMKEVREAANDLGIPQMAIATHIDLICDEIQRDVTNVYRSKVLKNKMEYFSSIVGIPVNYIFPVRNNYEGANQEAVDVVFLTALKRMLVYGDDFLFDTVQ